MIRKVVKQGDSTLMVSLPSKWARKFSVNKGDDLDIQERNRSLVVSFEKGGSSEIKTAKIDISHWDPLVNRLLLSFFIRGYDELEVKYSDTNQVKRFQKEVISTELLGWEIIKQSSNIFVVRDLSGSESGKFEEVLGRLFFMIDNMCEELTKGLEKKQIQELTENDKVINRLSYYCMRLLNKKGYGEFEKTSQVYSIITLLEETADLFKDMSKKKAKNSKEDIETLKSIRLSLDLVKKLSFKFDRSEAIKLAQNYEKIKKNISPKSELGSYLHTINGNIIRMNNELLVMNVDSIS